MGGQACIIYGAAEFSRDTDFAILCSPENLERLREALSALHAEAVFFPPLEIRYLERGHACHFRCRHPEALGLRIDVLSVMRGCDPFPLLWERRETFDLPGLPGVALLSLRDLVRSKKTQRDKDWPMIRRLIEADFGRRAGRAAPDHVLFWLRESRTPNMLVRLSAEEPALARGAAAERPLLSLAVAGGEDALERALFEEEIRERAEDRAYWAPLRRELEEMRRRRGPA
ncbi:MAG: hypothetical protein JXP34_11675 [Planctomycetes bacterium]|nr:hypothetical protein [Planctomycetota bacterium]